MIGSEGMARVLAEGILEIAVTRSVKMVNESLAADGEKLPDTEQLDWVVAGAYAATAQTINLLSELGLMNTAGVDKAL